jgi:hypothetical protein
MRKKNNDIDANNQKKIVMKKCIRVGDEAWSVSNGFMYLLYGWPYCFPVGHLKRVQWRADWLK